MHLCLGPVWPSGLPSLRLPVRKSGSRTCPSPCSRSTWTMACSGTGPAGSGSSGRSAGPGRWRGWGRRRRPPSAPVCGRKPWLRKRRRKRSPGQRQRRCCCRCHLPCWDRRWLLWPNDRPEEEPAGGTGVKEKKDGLSDTNRRKRRRRRSGIGGVDVWINPWVQRLSVHLLINYFHI